MTDDELLGLFRILESDRVERKESLADHDRIRQVICAHATTYRITNRPASSSSDSAMICPVPD